MPTAASGPRRRSDGDGELDGDAGVEITGDGGELAGAVVVAEDVVALQRGLSDVADTLLVTLGGEDDLADVLGKGDLRRGDRLAGTQRTSRSAYTPAIALRREVEVAREQIATAPSEAAVRKIVADLNSRIVEVNSTTVTGPTSTIMPLDVQRVVRHRRPPPSD